MHQPVTGGGQLVCWLVRGATRWSVRSGAGSVGWSALTLLIFDGHRGAPLRRPSASPPGCLEQRTAVGGAAPGRPSPGDRVSHVRQLPLISLERDVRGSYEQRHRCRHVDRYRSPPCSGSSHSGTGPRRTRNKGNPRQFTGRMAIQCRRGGPRGMPRPGHLRVALRVSHDAGPHCSLTCWLATGIPGRIRGSDERARSGRGGRNCERPPGIGQPVHRGTPAAEDQRASAGRAPGGPDQCRHPVHRPR